MRPCHVSPHVTRLTCTAVVSARCGAVRVRAFSSRSVPLCQRHRTFVDVAGGALDTAVEWVLRDYDAQQRSERQRVADYYDAFASAPATVLADVLPPRYSFAFPRVSGVWVIVTTPPRNAFHVTPMFAFAFLRASAVEARAMWRVYYRAHFAAMSTSGAAVLARAHAAATADEGCDVDDAAAVPAPALYWLFGVLQQEVHYAVLRDEWVHRLHGSDTKDSARVENVDGDGEDEAGVVAQTQRVRRSTWVPLRLLSLLPFFPLPQHVARWYANISSSHVAHTCTPVSDTMRGKWRGYDNATAAACTSCRSPLPYPSPQRVPPSQARTYGHVTCRAAPMSDAAQVPVSKCWSVRLDVTRWLTCPYIFDMSTYPFLLHMSVHAWQRRAQLLWAGHAAHGEEAACVAQPHTAQPRRPTVLPRSVSGIDGRRNKKHSSSSSSSDKADDMNMSTCSDGAQPRSVAALLAQHMHALQWWSTFVKVCGVSYVDVASTTMACLFDSSTCSRHVIPLTEDGAIFFDAMDVCRLRALRSTAADVSVHTADDASAAVHADNVTTSTTATTTTTRTTTSVACAPSSTAHAYAASRAMWLNRIDAVQKAAGSLSYANMSMLSRNAKAFSASVMELAIDKRVFGRNVDVLFHSPYWLRVDTLRERWGVDVAAGAVPVPVRNVLYVNAEETTDASRFDCTTCSAQTQHQQILCRTGLHTCTWRLSRLLRARVRQACQVHTRSSSSSSSNSDDDNDGKTTALMCNLWVTREIVDEAGWTLTTTTTTSHAADMHTPAIVVDVPSSLLAIATTAAAALSSTCSSLYTSTSSAAVVGDADDDKDSNNNSKGDVAASTAVLSAAANAVTSAQVTLVHAASIVQRDELVAVLRYTPLIYLDKMDELVDGDIEYVEWCQRCTQWRSSRRRGCASALAQWTRGAPSSPHEARDKDNKDSNDDDDDDDGHDKLGMSNKQLCMAALQQCAALPRCAYARACAAYCAHLTYTRIDDDDDNHRDTRTRTHGGGGGGGGAGTLEVLCDADTTPFDHMRYCQVHRKLLRDKRRRCNRWALSVLPFEYRLQLALLALRHRGTAEHREVWAARSFLAKERTVALRGATATVVRVDVVEYSGGGGGRSNVASHGSDASPRLGTAASHSCTSSSWQQQQVYGVHHASRASTAASAAAAAPLPSMSYFTLELVHRAELCWPEDDGQGMYGASRLWIAQRF